jgi:carboxylate-amine ligase
MRDLQRYVQNEAETNALKRLRHIAYDRLNDAVWLRRKYKERGSLNDVTRLACELWKTDSLSHYLQ